MSEHRTSFRFLGFITCLYITFQLVSDVTAGKIIGILYPVSASVLYFPITFLFSDILTEVYGYARARSVLWIVMACSVTAGLIYSLVVILPPGEGFTDSATYSTVLGRVPRVLVGGWLAVFAGDIVNNFVLAKLKLVTNGKLLWVRTIGSTIAGQLINTVIFYGIGLSGILPLNELLEAILAGWTIKVSVEALFTPLTYVVVKRLKKAEQCDVYDRETNFNPFIWKSPF